MGKEICLIIEGESKIKTEAGESFLIKSGDLVEFTEGLSLELILKIIPINY